VIAAAARAAARVARSCASVMQDTGARCVPARVGETRSVAEAGELTRTPAV
jgi:hypothetical protein